jgi:membrane fusion protein, multidrug efflux system
MEKDMNTNQVESKGSSPIPARPEVRGPAPKKAARITVFTAVLLTTLAAVALGVPWLIYRQNHTVLGNAVVRGTVAKLGARIDGQVKEVLVAVGQHVIPGQVLLQLEDSHLQASLQREQAELESALQELQTEKLAIAQERRRLTLDIARVNGLRRSAIAAQEGEASNLDKLDKEFARVNSLMREGIAAGSDLDRITGDRGKAQASVRSAQAERDAAEASYQTAQVALEGLDVREARLAVLESHASVARARIAAVKADLAAAVIRAPQEGWVVERTLEPGGAAKVGEPLMALWVGRPWIEAWLDQKQLDRIQIGSVVDVSLDAFPGRLVQGRVEALGLMSSKELQDRMAPTGLSALVHKSSMVPVRIAMAEGSPQLQPGLSAVVGIEKEASKTPLFAGTFLARLLSVKSPNASNQSNNK